MRQTPSSHRAALLPTLLAACLATPAAAQKKPVFESVTTDRLNLTTLGATGRLGASTATLAGLRAMPTAAVAEGAVVQVAGARAAGDGGGGAYSWAPTALTADDGCRAVRPTALSAAAPGRWMRAPGAITVRCFGATLDAKQDDAPAFNAARSAAGDLGAVEVGPGKVNLGSPITGGSAGPILWRLSGNTYPGGAFPVTGIGTDVVETFAEKSKFFGRGASSHGSAPVLRVDSRITHAFDQSTSTDAAEQVIPGLKVYQFVEPAGRLDDFPWGISQTTRSTAYGKAQIVGIASQMIRPSDALADGKGPRSQLWGGYIEVGDETNRPSNESGSMVGIEMGMFANSGDPNGSRIAFDIGIGRRNGQGVAARFNRGLHFGSADGQYGYSQPDFSFFGKVISIESNFDTAAFDTTGALAIGGAPAIRLRDGHKIAFDAGGTHHLRWEAAGLRYSAGGNELLTVRDDGSMAIAGGLSVPGTLTASGPLVVPEATAPTSTSDPSGSVGEVRFAGRYAYRKTTSGWYRWTLDAF